jgi:hypothetical protein
MAGGGFLGPLGVGLMLDLCGADNLTGWGLAFGHLALVTAETWPNRKLT